MALRDDSYGSVAEVLSFTPHLLDGQTTFNSTTVPTLTQVEKYIDRVSSYVNIALQNSGFTTPVDNTTAKLVLDDWAVTKAAEYTELSLRGAGYSEEEGSRTATFNRIGKAAMKFVADNALGFKRIGVGVSHKTSEGLAFTGIDDQDERSDPTDSALEQPMFTRNKFGAYSNEAADED